MASTAILLPEVTYSLHTVVCLVKALLCMSWQLVVGLEDNVLIGPTEEKLSHLIQDLWIVLLSHLKGRDRLFILSFHFSHLRFRSTQSWKRTLRDVELVDKTRSSAETYILIPSLPLLWGFLWITSVIWVYYYFSKFVINYDSQCDESLITSE